MEFTPVISPDLKEMDKNMFLEHWGELHSILNQKQLVRTI